MLGASDGFPPITNTEVALVTAPEASPATPDQSKLNLRPLASLMPYVKRYRGRALAAFAALILAAVTTLVVPIAVRRMIDFGFTGRGLALINSYFLVMIGVAAVLAFASAARYYLVTTLGERIVADLRGDVFAHLTSLSAVFFDTAKTGEMVSRLTADTTQIKASVGSSISVALRNLVLFFGASTMMVVTSPRLSAFVLGAIPIIVLPLYGFGRAVRRRSRAAQDTLADGFKKSRADAIPGRINIGGRSGRGPSFNPHSLSPVVSFERAVQRRLRRGGELGEDRAGRNPCRPDRVCDRLPAGNPRPRGGA